MSSYRPISITCHVSKILEHQVNKQLIQYLIDIDLITLDQSAYLKKHSSQTCLHRIVDDWLSNYDDSQMSGICFLDIEQYFDCIDHTILIHKLKWFGIESAIEYHWFENYLLNRKQVVRYNSETSNAANVTIGVPQGSVLGPVLFLIQ
mgnify:FL=1